MLKVLIDARKINDGGIGSYLRSLLEALSLYSDVSLSALVPNFCSQLPLSVNQIPNSTKPYSVSEYLSLGKKISANVDFDLFHSPHYTLPFFIKTPAVVTVHDTIHLTHPQAWYYPFISKILISSAIARANAVISVSEASKEALLSSFSSHSSGDLAARISVVENAAPAWLSSDKLESGVETYESITLPVDFILGVFSQNKAHKGLTDLLRAYSELKFEQRLPDLVLAGFGIEQFCQENPTQIRDFSSLGIHLLGSVHREQLKVLYSTARVLILPSIVEGFGLTALEAKVLGCPVLTRPLPSVQVMLDSQDRVCGDMSFESLKSELALVAQRFPVPQNRELNSELARKYSLENLAAKTIEVYRQAMES